MPNNNIDELLNLIREASNLFDEELKKLNESVDRLINNKITDEYIISIIFERMLSLVFIDENELKIVYDKLLNYTKSFNEELSKDYEELYIDQKLELLEEYDYNDNKRIIGDKNENKRYKNTK